jgi:hypothetical protein
MALISARDMFWASRPVSKGPNLIAPQPKLVSHAAASDSQDSSKDGGAVKVSINATSGLLYGVGHGNHMPPQMSALLPRTE